jgi:hypothetical protein
MIFYNFSNLFGKPSNRQIKRNILHYMGTILMSLVWLHTLLCWQVFQIVTGGERLLTGRDLRYSDADIDTQPTDIVYTRRGIPNGGIYQASDPTVCYQLMQEISYSC